MSVEKIHSQSTLRNVESLSSIKIKPHIETSNQDNEIVKPVSKEKIEKVLTSLNEFLQPSQTHLKYELHEKLKEYYVTLVDSDTNEIIKEIPSKKILDIYSAMTEFIGLMFDKKI